MTPSRMLDLPARLPHIGEIRGGEKVPTRSGTGTRPARLEKWRLTGPEGALHAAAAVYGGEPRPWDAQDATPGAWELYTNTDTLHVTIDVQDARSLHQAYELWSGGGLLRRCDGRRCELTTVTRNGDDVTARTDEVDCQCDPDAPEGRECKPTTLARVTLPLVPAIGTWRLVTHSVYAAMEIAGAVELLRRNGAVGDVPCLLRISQREQKAHGNTKRFPVPVLEPQVPMAALLGAGVFADATWTEHRERLIPAHAGDQGAERAALPAPTDPDALQQAAFARLLAVHDRDDVKAAWNAVGSPHLADPDAEAAVAREVMRLVADRARAAAAPAPTRGRKQRTTDPDDHHPGGIEHADDAQGTLA